MYVKSMLRSLILVLLALNTGFAAPKNSDETERYIQTKLKDEVLVLFGRLQLNKITDSCLQGRVAYALIDSAMATDILDSDYLLEECSNNVVQLDGISTAPIKNAPLCFSPKMSSDTVAADDIALRTAKAHLTHFGFTLEETKDVFRQALPPLLLTSPENTVSGLSFPRSEYGSIRFYLLKAALENGILGRRVITTDWMIPEAAVGLSFSTNDRIRKYIETSLFGSSPYPETGRPRVQIYNTQIEEAVVKKETNKYKLFRVNAELKAGASQTEVVSPLSETVPQEIMQYTDGHLKLGSFLEYASGEKIQEVRLLRFRITFEQDPETISYSQLSQTRVQKALDLESQAQGLNERLIAMTTCAATTGPIQFFERDRYVEVNWGDDRYESVTYLASAPGKKTFWPAFVLAYKPILEAVNPVGLSGGSYVLRTQNISQRSGSYENVVLGEDFLGAAATFAGTVKRELSDYRNTVATLQDLERTLQIPSGFTRKIIQDYRRLRDQIALSKLGVEIQMYGRTQIYTFVSEKDYSGLLLEGENTAFPVPPVSSKDLEKTLEKEFATAKEKVLSLLNAPIVKSPVIVTTTGDRRAYHRSNGKSFPLNFRYILSNIQSDSFGAAFKVEFSESMDRSETGMNRHGQSSYVLRTVQTEDKEAGEQKYAYASDFEDAVKEYKTIIEGALNVYASIMERAKSAGMSGTITDAFYQTLKESDESFKSRLARYVPEIEIRTTPEARVPATTIEKILEHSPRNVTLLPAWFLEGVNVVLTR